MVLDTSRQKFVSDDEVGWWDVCWRFVVDRVAGRRALQLGEAVLEAVLEYVNLRSRCDEDGKERVCSPIS